MYITPDFEIIMLDGEIITGLDPEDSADVSGGGGWGDIV